MYRLSERWRGVGGSVRVITLTLAVASVGTMACRTTPTPRTPDICLGDEVLAVRNDTGESVDIYEVRGSNSRIIGTVGAGRTEFPLPAEILHQAGFRARRTKDGQWLTRAFGGRYGSSRILIRVECVGTKVK